MIVSIPVQTANISMADSLILMVLALVVFGPRRLPQIGRQIGKLMYEFRKASNDFKFQMEEELRMAEDADRRKKEEERQRQRALEAPPQESVSADPQIVNAVEVPEHARPAGEEIAASEEVTQGMASGAEESGPKVAPPSTGETVSAGTPPWKRAQYAEAVQQGEVTETTQATESVPESESAEIDPPQNHSAETTEAIGHNG
ncbi:MAG: twin-arginine translocase TatA/TatE family subunit [Acidobacteriota bacterium]|nr:twin-arginine translocase TatA/TatE family subunit [Acidobacteriota bacterium]